MEKTVKHFCTTANRIKTDSAEFIKNVDWKKVGTGLGVTAVATGLVVITGGAAGPIILGALIGGGSSAAINGAVTALNGGSIADVAKSASNGFMWGAIGGAAGGAVGSSLSPVINRVFGNGLTAALVNGGLSGAAGGGLTGGMESGAAGNNIGRVLEDAAKGAGVGAAIGAASAGIGYGIKSLGSGGTTGSGGESGSKTKGVGNPVDVVGRGSTGRIVPNTLNEQMAMHQVMSNPLEGAVDMSQLKNHPVIMSDSRWLASEGWVKMSNNVNGVEIHFVYNKITGVFDDFKFK